jgi:hypothetical protein
MRSLKRTWEIVWKERSGLQAFGGHGVDFLVDPGGEPDSVIAVIRGFAWLHTQTDTIEIWIRPADESYDEAFLAEARQDIASYLLAQKPGPPRWISPSIYAHVNA